MIRRTVAATGTPRGAVGRYWIGIDIGGTFSDYVIYDSQSGQTLVHKTPTPASRRAEVVLSGLDAAVSRYGINYGDIAFIGHGTTVATNVLLTRDGPPVGLLTTDGFGDMLVIRRQTRADTFDYYADFPLPLVPRDQVVEISERVDARGVVLIPIDVAEVERALRDLTAAGVRSVAISFLHSYANPVHEHSVREAAEAFPELLVSLSSDLVPEYREYERTSTTVVNAFVQPVVQEYLMSFRRGLDDRGVSSPLVIMQGNGGLMSAQTAARQPVALIRSGPAAGVAGAAYLAGLAEEHNIITLDMGGTSTDVAVFAGERPPPVRDWDVFSFPIRWTALDIRSIGAGGGSIAWIDGGGLLKVGPQSAGAEPGPSCYERGGVIATVTDATVVLSRIGPNALLGGSIVVNAERARSAIEDLARSLGYEVEETAAGIIEIVNAAIAQEIHLICAERGFPARDYTLVAFGGAGGLHASEVAAELGIQKVLVPARPGLLCALGVLTSVPRADFGITRLMPMLPGDPQLAAEFEAVRSNVTQRATQWLEEQRIPSRSVDLEWTAELRYRGQNYELPVKMPSGPIDGDLLIAEFHAQHEHTYGYRSEAVEVQCVAVRLLLSIDVDHPALRPSVTQKVSVVSAPRRLVHMGRRWGFVDSAIYRREEMPIGSIFTGPAIVEQMDATTLILPDQRGLVDPWGNIMLTKRETA